MGDKCNKLRYSFFACFVGLSIYLFALNIPKEYKDELKALILHPASASRIRPLEFILFAILVLTVPSIPGSALYFLAGRFYGVWNGILYMCFSNQVGCMVAFCIARFIFYKRVSQWVSGKSKFHIIKEIAEKNQWKTAFLVRFIFIPTQLKSIVIAVTPVSLICFSISVFLGDMQSLCTGVYLGSLTRFSEDSKESSITRTLRYSGFLVAIIMSLVASHHAQKEYRKATSDGQSINAEKEAILDKIVSA